MHKHLLYIDMHAHAKQNKTKQKNAQVQRTGGVEKREIKMDRSLNTHTHTHTHAAQHSVVKLWLSCSPPPSLSASCLL